MTNFIRISLKTAFVAVIFLLPFSPVTGQSKKLPDATTIHRVHEKALTVDTHCDTPMDMVESGFDIGKRNSSGEVDLVRMKEGGLDAMFFAAFTGQKKRTETNYAEAYHMVNQMIDTTKSAVARYANLAEIALKSEDAARLEKLGKRAVFIGIENGFPLAKEIGRVEEFYQKGARYITLCHSYNNDICDSSTDPKGAEHNGLSPFGKQVVKEMNRVGMIIDVSHISDKSFFDVLETSKSPVIASHSSVRAIAHHNRNLSDEMIKKLAQNGGVIQICLLDEYIQDPDTTTIRYKKEREMRKIYNEKQDSMTPEEKATLRKEWGELRAKYPKNLPHVKQYVDHIDHVVKLVGVDYVGIGSDFDGGGALADCRDVSQFPNITRELLIRGYSESDIQKMWGGNFFRVFREVEENARKLAGK